MPSWFDKRLFVSMASCMCLCEMHGYCTKYNNMAPNIRKAIFLWILGNTLCITKILDPEILVLYRVCLNISSQCRRWGWRAPCHTKWLTFSYLSIQFYSCNKPGSVKIASLWKFSIMKIWSHTVCTSQATNFKLNLLLCWLP